jgi:hypothetical protein
MLAPLFATMSPDHPQRVAKWLAEVFCGPKASPGNAENTASGQCAAIAARGDAGQRDPMGRQRVPRDEGVPRSASYRRSKTISSRSVAQGPLEG